MSLAGLTILVSQMMEPSLGLPRLPSHYCSQGLVPPLRRPWSPSARGPTGEAQQPKQIYSAGVHGLILVERAGQCLDGVAVMAGAQSPSVAAAGVRQQQGCAVVAQRCGSCGTAAGCAPAPAVGRAADAADWRDPTRLAPLLQPGRCRQTTAGQQEQRCRPVCGRHAAGNRTTSE